MRRGGPWVRQGGLAQLYYDAAKAKRAWGGASTPGDYTVGVEVFPFDDLTLLGLRVYWADAAAATLRLEVYDATITTPLASVDVAASGVNLYEGMFASPVALSKSNQYRISMRETSGTNFMTTLGTGQSPVMPLMIGPSMMAWYSYYCVGAGLPTTQADPANQYPVAPIYTIP